MESGASRSLALDYAIGVCGVWISGGFFLDAWAHGHVPVESFFTPYHAVFYSGMLALALILAAAALRARLAGTAWADVFPRSYRLALVGIPVFLAGAVGDMLWHRFFGIEEGVDALLSPTHQILGLGIFMISCAPIRSVLADRTAATLSRQMPFVLGMSTWLILAHFGTAYALDPAAGRSNAPPPIAPFTSDYLTALSIGYYKVATGVLIVVFESTLIAGFAIWIVSRLRPAFGAITLLLLIGNLPAAAAFTNETPLLAITAIASLLAGLVGDVLVARTDPSATPQGATALRAYAAAVPMTFIGTYLIGIALTGGLWWSWNIALGSWIWSGVCGFALSLLVLARRAA